MNKIRLLIGIVIMLVLCSGFTYAATDPIKITLDGKLIKTDTDPVVKSGRTLVPAAVIVDNIGGESFWDDKNREVTITYQDTVIKLKIDSKDAYIDEQKVTLDVPATIINNRTVVPLRFISEAMKYEVSYDSKNRVAIIKSPKITAAQQSISQVNILAGDSACRVEIKGTSVFNQYSTMTLTGPDRFVVDVKYAALTVNALANAQENPFVSDVRMSQFTEQDARIVVDLKSGTKPVVSTSEDKKALYLDFGSGTVTNGYDGTYAEVNRGSETDRTLPQEIPAINFYDTYLVVIDPGHGGSDPGSQGKENGKAVLNEKDLNLPIALRLRDKLEAAGISTYMTREKDVNVALASRPAIANELNAALLVGIHNNSIASGTVNGTEVLYYNKDIDSLYGMGSGKEIATAVGNQLKKEMSSIGINFNKYSERPGLAVLNKSVMPAIIVEGAYLSNASDRAIMKTDEFIESYATAVANGIIEVMKNRTYGE